MRNTPAAAGRQAGEQVMLLFSWRTLWRDWRGGELRILAVALVIAVTAVSAVGFFIDRVDRGIQQQAAELIAADLVISAASLYRQTQKPVRKRWGCKRRIRCSSAVSPLPG